MRTHISQAAMIATALLLVLGPGPRRAFADGNDTPILANLTLDQLGDVEIVSASQRAESEADVPAAVRVVTSQDIAQSGATSIPEALRGVPGLDVAQINGTTWAIGARGFQSEFADKLLVMADGVSVYTPIYGGVFWDEENDFMPDIDRIEVVLGPGGAIWGANAMNGVVNVISKSAQDTQGGLVYGGGGAGHEAMAGARYGWLLATNTYARVYGSYGYNGPDHAPGGGDAQDATSAGEGGFRVDGFPRYNTEWTLKGDAHWAVDENQARIPELTDPPGYVFTNDDLLRETGGRLSGHWQTEASPDSTLQLQGYYDYSQRMSADFNFDVDTADVELHHTWSGWRRQVIDWGLDGRMEHVDTGPAWVMFVPAHDTTWLGSGFVQDEISLAPDTLQLTAGVKLEGHSDVGFLPQPNARLTWHPAARHTFWAAWSRALRSPAEVELNGMFDVQDFPPGALNPMYPTAFRYLGNPDVKPEELQAWEAGWRWEPAQHFKLDVDGYYYQYRDLIMQTYGTPYLESAPVQAEILPTMTVNGTEGDSYGGEAALTWQPCEAWFATASYSVRHTMLRSAVSDPFDYAGDSVTSPRQTVSFVSGLKLGGGWKLTGALRYVDNIPFYNVPAYFDLDAQLAWQPCAHLEFALAGQNLLQDYHTEYRASLIEQSTEIPRGVYAKVTWKF